MASANQPAATNQSGKNAGTVGSDPDAARSFGGQGDFGAAVNAPLTGDRDYVSQNTKRSDPGAANPGAWEADGVRDHGAGSPSVGAGSGSGGDLDPDWVGVGSGGTGLSTSGKVHDPAGPDDNDGTSNEYASGAPAQGRNQTHAGQVGGSKRVAGGSTVARDLDMTTGPAGEGADAATNPSARGDDSFVGEVSSGEARDEDAPLSPSSDTQGLSNEDNQLPKDEGADDAE
jgi:hypothetical protein